MEANFTVKVVCDGGCLGNGSDNAKAYGSFAIVRKNGAELLSSRTDQFPELSTNNAAELMAALKALEAIQQKIESAGVANPHDVAVTVFTDSALVVGYFHYKKPWQRKEPTLRQIAARIDLQKTAFKSCFFVKMDERKVKAILGH